MPVRRFTDRQGVAWDVWETIPSQPSFVARELAGGWLTFSSATERRRLVPVPAQWEEAGSERLELYCRAATSVE